MTTLRVLVPAIPVPTVLLGLVVTLLDGSAPGLAIRLAGLLAVIACLCARARRDRADQRCRAQAERSLSELREDQTMREQRNLASSGTNRTETWHRVEDYFDAALVGSDDSLEAALRASEQAGLPPINVSPSQGKLLSVLARGIGAQRILEIGTLGGYSTIWLARALPAAGRLISLELNPHHAEVARQNLGNAGLSDLVEIRIGPAIDSLEALGAAGEPPFDLVFVDADKQSNADYFAWAVRLTHPGSLIIVDNVVRNGEVADATSSDSSVKGVRRLIEALAAEPRVDATAVQTVGSKGYDGFAIGIVVDPKA